MRKIKLASVLPLIMALAACSWSTEQVGPDSYEISGYFDFTMKGSLVAQGLEMQAEAYCKTIGADLVPQIYSINYQNRVFNYEANRASAVVKFHCVKPENKNIKVETKNK